MFALRHPKPEVSFSSSTGRHTQSLSLTKAAWMWLEIEALGGKRGGTYEWDPPLGLEGAFFFLGNFFLPVPLPTPPYSSSP